MLIKYRIYLSLLLLSLLPLVLVSLLTERMFEGELRQNIVGEFQNLAREKADSIGRHLDERINETRLLASHPTIIAAVKEVNSRYQGRDEHAVMDEIHRLDEVWIANKGATEKAGQISTNNISHFLKTIQARNPEVYGEIFITDRLGANVAMTRTLSDYYQADEYWWQTGGRHVRDGAFLDDRGFDESVGAIVIGVVVPVIDDGEMIGVFKINFKVRPILDIVSAEGLEPGYVLLLARSDGNIISCSDESHMDRLIKEEVHLADIKEEMRLAENGEAALLERKLQAEGILSARYPMKHRFSTRQIQGGVKGVTGETTQVKTWYVIYEVDQAIAFASINKLRETAIWLAIGALFLVALIGVSLSRAITRPLLALRSGAEIIGGGNLAHHITLGVRDEFSVLADSFNNMAQKLWESEGQFRALVTNTEEIVYMIAQDGTFTLSEGKGLVALGLEPGEVVGKSVFELYKDHPDSLGEIRRSLNGETVITEAKVGDNYFSIRYTPHKNSEGEIIGILGLSVNITEQKQAEAAMLDSKQRLIELMESVPVGISVSNLEGQITEANNIAVEIFGYDSKESFMSAPAADRYSDPQDRERFVKLLKKGPVRDFELRLKREDGSLFWCSVSSVIHNAQNGTVQFISAFMDITGRQQMEAELRKLAQAVEQSPESIIITDVNTEIEYVNNACEEISGYRKEELIGKNPRILRSGKTQPETYKAMWAALRHGEPWKGEFYNKHKDGAEYTEFAMVSPLRQLDGSITHYVAVKEDITEKKQLAVELDKHRHHLEELVEERTVQLAEAGERAEAANQAKSVFLANMSHEIRTPMNAIIGLTHLLQRAGPEPEQVKRLNKIDAAAMHLLSIINNILDISKIEAGKLTLEQTDFHLDSIFDQIQSLLKGRADDKKLTIEVEQNDVPNWLRGDPTRLSQALLNYVGNAIKFTDQGSVILRAIKLDERDDEILLRFEVQDTGIGIEADKLPGMFRAFKQGDATATRKNGGTGLGLTITKHLSRLMGGDVGVVSEPGRGSTFWLTVWISRGQGVLPVAQLPVTHPGHVAESETELRSYYSGSCILLVEDNAINREVALELLWGAGLAVDTAENGQQAVEKVRASDYDLILMDIQMPEMDGLEATRVIRAMAGKAGLPILAMTANVFEDDRIAYIKAGMNDFIAKPFDLDILFSKLIQWLPKHAVSVETVSTSVTPSSPAAEQGDAPINPMVLSKLLGDDTDKHLAILRKFIPQVEGIVAEINTAYGERDAEKVTFLSHKLISSARAVGAATLADLCLALEKAGRDGDWSVIDTLCPELVPAMERVVDYISRL